MTLSTVLCSETKIKRWKRLKSSTSKRTNTKSSVTMVTGDCHILIWIWAISCLPEAAVNLRTRSKLQKTFTRFASMSLFSFSNWKKKKIYFTFGIKFNKIHMTSEKIPQNSRDVRENSTKFTWRQRKFHKIHVTSEKYWMWVNELRF